MTLTDDQLARFDEEGYLFLPGVFSKRRGRRSCGARCRAILAQDRPEVVREKDGKTPRTAFAAHTYTEPSGASGGILA